MRTATNETRRALRAAIGDGHYSTWAKAHGLKPATIHGALHKLPMKARRENAIRDALGLPPILSERVVIDPDRQKIVNIQGPRDYKSEQIRLSLADDDVLKEIVRALGYRSLNQLWHSERVLEYLSSLLERGQEQCNGYKTWNVSDGRKERIP